MSHLRADALILARQRNERVEESRVNDIVSERKVLAKANWENRTANTIVDNAVRRKVAEVEQRRKEGVEERRGRLSHLLASERAHYEKELKDREQTPAQRMDKMAQRAWELKKRREDERQKVVQEKLYQQWRSSIDELRHADSKLFELETMAARDDQVENRLQRSEEEEAENAVFDALWQEGYQAKVEREEREKALKVGRNDEANRTIAQQLAYKEASEELERRQRAKEQAHMRAVWDQQEKEVEEQKLKEQIASRVERKKMDEYMTVQNEQRSASEKQELLEDKQFVLSVLAKERALAEQEALEKQRSKDRAAEFNEALKLEMARKAESEEELVRMQFEEQEKQWQKRYAQWEIEEMARRNLLEEVYSDRARQVEIKQEARQAMIADRLSERQLLIEENSRLEDMEAEKQHAEALMRKRHQEELFRQMDFHQVQRHRELQQHAIEQRQAMITEEKLQRALEAERAKQRQMGVDIFTKRAEVAKRRGLTAPWEK
jgi:hypothetical protein